MATQIFLGKPSASVEAWIKGHPYTPTPAGHPETIVTWKDGTVRTYNITGELAFDLCEDGCGDEFPFLDNYTQITEIDIGNTVTSINFQFDYGPAGEFVWLQSVTIPDSVMSIMQCAFRNCPRLTSVKIGNGMTRIGSAVFEETRSLYEIDFRSKTRQQVNSLDPSNWGLGWSEYKSSSHNAVIHCSDGDINIAASWVVDDTTDCCDDCCDYPCGDDCCDDCCDYPCGDDCCDDCCDYPCGDDCCEE